MSKTVGILGGMGPMSTVNLMRMITERTPVKHEREHLRILVDSRPQIPDRPAALLGRGESPVPMMRDSARLLEQWGADLIAIPCNTAHGFLVEVQEAVGVEILDMIGLVGRELASSFPAGTPVGLLATAATAQARVFHDKLPGFQLLTPSPAVHETLVAPAILQVKLENDMLGPGAGLLRALSTLEPEPRAVIAGCTEVELALAKADAPLPIILPMTLLAQEIVDRAWQA